MPLSSVRVFCTAMCIFLGRAHQTVNKYFVICWSTIPTKWYLWKATSSINEGIPTTVNCFRGSPTAQSVIPGWHGVRISHYMYNHRYPQSGLFPKPTPRASRGGIFPSNQSKSCVNPLAWFAVMHLVWLISVPPNYKRQKKLKWNNRPLLHLKLPKRGGGNLENGKMRQFIEKVLFQMSRSISI